MAPTDGAEALAGVVHHVRPMRVLVTGVSGFVGDALVAPLMDTGHDVVGFARDPTRVRAPLPVVSGDAVTGEGLAEAMEGAEVAYFLIHSMEASAKGLPFADRERRAAENFAREARAAGVKRIVYLGGPVPQHGGASPHLASRLAVEEVLLGGSPSSVALRASIVIGARSRSFRFLVRLVERLPLMVLPSWHVNRTQPIDQRDMLEFLLRAATAPDVAGQSLDIAGPDVLSYGEMIERIADAMLVDRPAMRVGLSVTPVASRFAAAVAGEDPSLIEPLMEGLAEDLLPRDDRAVRLLGVKLHPFDRAVEHALREWESREPLAAR